VAATLLARAGHQVVLIERGSTPGSKNLSGGVLYGRVLETVFPDYAAEAPVERRITKHTTTFLNADSAVSIDYWAKSLAKPVNAVTVLRAHFDEWLASQAEEAGAFLMAGVRVDELMVESGQVVGVRAGEDELRTRLVVAADGVNSFLARAVGLRGTPRQEQVALGVKGVLRMDPKTIEDRFGVRGGEGAAHAIVGDCTKGVAGGAFLYTNKSSLSLGVVMRLDDLIAKGFKSSDIFEHCYTHPGLAPYLDGGELIEYGSHLVAEGGLEMLGEVSSDGLIVIGEAVGLTINSGFAVRGMDLAIGSAIIAARLADAALRHGDTSAQALDYRQRLLGSYIGQDLKTYAKAPAFLHRNRLYSDYGMLAAEVFRGVFSLDTTPRQHLLKCAREAVRGSGVGYRKLLADGLAGVRSL
jgi:electron transfer flavoprotein-quinone oxidoreductase